MAKEFKENRTAVYIRVSTEDQAREGHSLDEQLDRIKEFCNYKKLDIQKVYKDDGKSAKDMKGRPEFLKMVSDVKSGKINNICIYKLDRLTRSVRDLEEILVLLEESDCGLMSVSEEINTKGYMGVFFIRLTILLAQLEIDQTKERTVMGLIGTVKQGIPIGKLPLGYRRDVNNSDSKLKKKAIIYEEEAKTIRKIFNFYLKGYSYYYIAQKLVEENNTQMKWKDWVIQQIINNVSIVVI
jgi:site-specific DNA recombinase